MNHVQSLPPGTALQRELGVLAEPGVPVPEVDTPPLPELRHGQIWSQTLTCSPSAPQQHHMGERCEGLVQLFSDPVNTNIL